MEDLLAQAVGFLAMLFCLLCYQIKDSRLLILCKALGDTIYVIHYLMLGAYSGCVTMAFCAINGIVCSFRGNQAWADWKGWRWTFSVLLTLASFVTWQTSFQPIPSICSLVSIVSVIQTTWTGNGKIIRLGKLLVVGPTWLIYCLAVRSYSGILCELFGIGSAAIAIWRYRQRKPSHSTCVQLHKLSQKRSDADDNCV